MSARGFISDARPERYMVQTVADVSSYEPTSVDSQEDLISAIEEMFENNYSQLGVERDGELIGVVSYRSISRVLSILRKLGVRFYHC